MSFWSNLFQRKQSRALTVVSQQEQGSAKHTPKNYDAMSQQGYQLNAICYDAVRRVSQSVASINWVLYQTGRNGKREEITEHPLLSLLKRPNPSQAKAAFFESLVAFYQLTGNTFIEGVRGTGKQFKELWTLPPSAFKIVPGDMGIPREYIFQNKGKSIFFEVDQVTGQSDIMHMKRFHPRDVWWGLSPLEPAMLAIDGHNAAAKWNLALIQNNARPGGVIQITQDVNGGMGRLTDEEYENLKKQIEDQYSGPYNAGKLLLLEGGMDWKQIALNPKDLDWIKGTEKDARNTSLALGVPPVLLHIPGDSTYNNVREARLALFEDTVIPIAESIRDEFNRWLVPAYGEGLELDIDKDKIDALNVKRELKFKQYQEADYLTVNEKREAVGYEPRPDGDTLAAKPSPQIQPPTKPEPPEKTPPKEGGDDEEEDAGKSVVDLKNFNPFDVEIKQVNLLNRVEKLQSARKLNALRDFYSNTLDRELKEDYFEKIAADLKNLTTDNERMAESQAMKAIDQYDDELIGALTRAIKRTSQSFGEPILNGGKEYWGANWEVKKESDFTSWISFFVEKRAKEAAIIIKETTLRETRKIIRDFIATGVQEGSPVAEIAKGISDKFEQISKPRAAMIARTEVGVASNQGSLEAAKSLDIPDLKKEWVAVNDARTREDHRDLDGKKVEMNEKFDVFGSQMSGPQDPSGPANQVINCRCVLVFTRN